MAAVAYSASTLSALVKLTYTSKGVQNVAYNKKHRPLFSRLNKNKSFSGSGHVIPVIYSDGKGRSATFSTAQATALNSKQVAFSVDTVVNYSDALITRDLIRRTAKDEGAFVKAMKHAIDSQINNHSNDIESNLFRDKIGNIGTVSTIASGVVTLVQAGDVVNFSVGQEVVFAATSASALRDSGASGAITVVNVDAGTFTIGSTPSGTAASDLIWTKGDYVSASDVLKISGLQSWIPAADPSSTAFFGVDRSVDPSRLGGHRVSGSLSDIKGSIYDGCAKLFRHAMGGEMVAYMSPETFRLLNAELSMDVLRNPSGEGKAGYESIAIISPLGSLECVPAPFCPDGIVFILDMSSWELLSMGEVPSIIDDDGLMVERLYNGDSFEVRIASDCNLASHAPGNNCRVDLT